MSDYYYALSEGDQREVLEAAANVLGRPPHLLEKDAWVVWTLSHLFAEDLGNHLVFKGGTSLSKAYRVIERFSEDIDLTWDIRDIIPDLIEKFGGSALPPTTSQANRWTKAVREHLPRRLEAEVVPRLQRAVEREGLSAHILWDESEKVLLNYKQVCKSGSGYMPARVQLEFGGRATGQPYDVRDIVCDAAPYVAGVVFPTAQVKAMRPERTFWEKATAAHVYCRQGRFRGDTHIFGDTGMIWCS